jgi:large subunit ribosomal protein L13
MTTPQPKSSNVSRHWHLIDAKGQVLGRLATKITLLLLGKGKRIYTPHVDCGDVVVVINAADVKMTGANKLNEKIDFRHSGYPGGETMTPYREFLISHPDRAILLAVKGMLPKNRLRPRQLARLKIYKGATHNHGSQFNLKVKETAAVPA